jgi:acetyl esterase/lipase
MMLLRARPLLHRLRPLVALSYLAGCSPDRAATEAAPSDPTAHVYRIIGGDSLRLFMFHAVGQGREAPTSAVLLYHGGGWTAGSPDWTFASAREFANQGFVAISVQYRLSNAEWTPVDALSDVCASLRWVRRPSSDLGIDSTRVAGHGVSAGGHLIASTATVGCPSSDEPGRSTPDLVLLWSPALDVTGDGWFERQLQGRARATETSPAQHVHAGTPPTSIVHGEADTLAPLAGARRYCEALEALGTRCELNVYPGVGHLLTRNLANQESDFDPDPAARADGKAKQLEFLRAMGF